MAPITLINKKINSNSLATSSLSFIDKDTNWNIKNTKNKRNIFTFLNPI